VVKKNFFKNLTFAINESSFDETLDKEEYLECMRRIIYENGGKIVDFS
jgi:hypothetical protein